MNGNIRYPLMLLVSLVGTAFVDLAGASPISHPRHFQPNYFPLLAANSVERLSPRYSFRPVSRRGVNNPYRLPAAHYFEGCYGDGMTPSYAYSPQFRPARSYGPRVAGRNSWESTGHTFPRAGHFRTNHFRYQAPKESIGQRGVFALPRFVISRSTPNSGFTWGGIRQYRIRPDNQMAISQQAARAMDGGHQFPAVMIDRPVPSASAGYRFRPDNRLSRNNPNASRQLLSIFATSTQSATTSYVADGLNRFPETGFRSLPFDLTESVDAADLYDRSVPAARRTIGIYKFRSIAENTTG